MPAIAWRRLDPTHDGRLRRGVRLAEMAETAGCRTLGHVKVDSELARGSLHDWQLRIVTEADQPPLRLTRKRT